MVLLLPSRPSLARAHQQIVSCKSQLQEKMSAAARASYTARPQPQLSPGLGLAGHDSHTCDLAPRLATLILSITLLVSPLRALTYHSCWAR